MKTIVYKLKSMPGRSIEVSENCAKKAESLLKYISESRKLSKVNITDALSEHPYLRNPSIFKMAFDLRKKPLKSPNYSQLEDRIYISTCLHETEKEIEISNYLSLIKICRNLEKVIDMLEE